jgi:hypothetical protein
MRIAVPIQRFKAEFRCKKFARHVANSAGSIQMGAIEAKTPNPPPPATYVEITAAASASGELLAFFSRSTPPVTTGDIK